MEVVKNVAACQEQIAISRIVVEANINYFKGVLDRLEFYRVVNVACGYLLKELSTMNVNFFLIILLLLNSRLIIIVAHSHQAGPRAHFRQLTLIFSHFPPSIINCLLDIARR